MLSWMVLKLKIENIKTKIGFRSMLSWMVLKQISNVTDESSGFRSMLSWMVLKLFIKVNTSCVLKHLLKGSMYTTKRLILYLIR